MVGALIKPSGPVTQSTHCRGAGQAVVAGQTVGALVKWSERWPTGRGSDQAVGAGDTVDALSGL